MVDPLLDPVTLLWAITDRFNAIEREDHRIRTIYLHQREVDTLAGIDDFNMNPALPPGILGGLKGMLWGADVYVDDNVPEGYALFVPDGMQVTILSSKCCVRLVARKAPTRQPGR